MTLQAAYSIRAANPAAAMKPAGAAVRWAAGLDVDEWDSLLEPVRDSLLPVSEASVLAASVLPTVEVVAKVEPFVVIVDSITLAVPDPDSDPEPAVPEEEASVPAEKMVLVTVDSTALPLVVKEVSKVAVEIGIDPVAVAPSNSIVRIYHEINA